MLGRWFKRTGHRGDIFLATKFGFVKGGRGYEVDSSYEYCKRACAESLRLLDVDYIDLCECLSAPERERRRDALMLAATDYLHSADPATPIEETMRALAELQA